MVYATKSRHDLVILSIPLLILLELKKYTSNLCLMAAADIYITQYLPRIFLSKLFLRAVLSLSSALQEKLIVKISC